MHTALTVGTGFFWLLTYLLIIRQGFQDRTYGMPIVALAANISWEMIFSFIFPHPPLQRIANMGWLVLDAIIAYQILRFGPSRYTKIGRGLFYAMFAVVLMIAFGMVFLLTYQLQDWQGYYAAYGQSLLMSSLFLGMLYQRGSLLGQSVGIAWAKMAGTALASIGLYSYPGPHQGEPLMTFLYVTCTFLDVVYIVAVHRVRRATRGPTETDRKIYSPSG